ncbi:MAG: hypothetical protein J6P13_05995 [Kiritimatiellae bacterium]|nr:hypothetical protein [Kiritimatiellia bacterium]
MKPSYLRTFAVFSTVLAASCTWAYTGLQTKLSSTDFAETVEVDSKTCINVIGTGDAKLGYEWGWSKDVVYDGKVHMSNNAWFEPSYVNGENSGAWAGFGTKAGASVTKIRYYARNDGTEYAARAIGLQFQGATNAGFSDAVTLYTIPSTSLDDLTNGWQEVYLAPSTAKYTFFRIFGDYGGNLCEAEFYGTTEDLSASSAPSAPAFTQFALINGKLTYAFTAQADAYAYRVERRYAGESEWEALASHIYIDEGASVAGMVDCYLPGPADYRLVAVNLADETASALESVAYYKPLKGAAIQSEEGDVGSVFDGDIATGYQSSEDGQWLGLNLGAAKSVCGVRLMPKSSGDNWYNEYDKVGTADNPSFTNEITSDSLNASWETQDAPVYGFVTNYSFAAMTGSYVRYIANEYRKCSLAEIEFLTDEWTPDAAPGNLVISGATLTWDLPEVACMSSRVVRTTAQYGGSDVQTFDLRGDATSWTDTTAKAGITYYYTVQSVNNVGGVEYAGPASAQVSYRFLMQIERDENDQSQLRSGMTAIQSGKDYIWNSDEERFTSSANLFDGSMSSCADLSDGGCKVGIDLGDEYVITSFKFFPRGGYLERANGIILAASNNGDYFNNATAISGSCAVTEEQWYSFDTSSSAPWRYVFLQKDSDFYGNVAELQLFGYLASDAAGVVVAPTAAAAWSGSRVSVSWEGGSNAVSCDVERSEDGGTAWTTLASGVTGTQWIDATANFRKSYVYRLKANGTANYAYSSVVAPSGVGAPRGMILIIK